MFKIIFEERADKDLDKLPIEIAVKIRKIIGSLLNEPRPRGSKKLEGRGNLYRIRRGHYRVIYDINYESKEIRVILIKHRKEAYR